MSLTRNLRSLLLPLVGLSISGAGVACDGLLGVDFDDAHAQNDGGGGDAPDGNVPGGEEPDMPLIPASQVDLLLVVDNSASMGDKAQLLAKSIGTLIRDVARVGDLHVGVISSSLGNFGAGFNNSSDLICNEASNPRMNDRALLRTLDGSGATLAAASQGFLSYEGGDVESLVRNAQELVRGVGESGCGFEAQLESTYRFLVQPDPWVEITLNSANQAKLGTKIDYELLKQRKAFLRPDSALVVVMITDEDDSAVDPLSVGGQGWAYMARNFPGSKVFRRDSASGTTAPRGTSVCAVDPASPDCTSCGFQSMCNPADAACQRLKADSNCQQPASGQTGAGYTGYLAPEEDALNVRFHRMKERFGIDPQYPIARYTGGFSRAKVPNQAGEHEIKEQGGRLSIAGYVGTPNCTNPIFAATLPSKQGDEICDLPRGTRSRELVVFALLGGLPEALATETPNWQAILGKDPERYDYAGMDPHMIPSVTPRAGLALPSATRGNNGTDPAHGREWDTRGEDLQYVCTFPLQTPRSCTGADPACECANPESNPPLCSAAAGEQVRAKAYPTTRPLRVVHGLGTRGIVGSICAGSGYETTMRTLAGRLAPRLAL